VSGSATSRFPRALLSTRRNRLLRESIAGMKESCLRARTFFLRLVLCAKKGAAVGSCRRSEMRKEYLEPSARSLPLIEKVKKRHAGKTTSARK